MLKDAIDSSLDHLRPWLAWAKQEPETVEQKKIRLSVYQKSFQENKEYVYGIFTLDEKKLLGMMWLHARIWPDALEIWYRIRSSHSGQWYATEAATALLDVAFAHIGISCVEIHVNPENINSNRIPEKLWFTKKEKKFEKKTGERWRWVMKKEEYIR